MSFWQVSGGENEQKSISNNPIAFSRCDYRLWDRVRNRFDDMEVSKMMENIEDPRIRKVEITGYPEEYEPKMYCDWCEEALYEGDPYYEIKGEIICDICMDSIKQYA